MEETVTQTITSLLDKIEKDRNRITSWDAHEACETKSKVITAMKSEIAYNVSLIETKQYINDL